MNLSAILISSLWTALFSASMGFYMTTPFRGIVPCFLCGFTGRFARDYLISFEVSHAWSTLIAAAVVVFVGVAISRRRMLSPIVLICGILPLGASVAMFNMIADMIKVSTLKGEALSAATVALNSDLSKVITSSLAVALGLGIGITIMRLLQRE